MERSGGREICDDRIICQAHTSIGGKYGRTTTATAAAAVIAKPPRTSKILLYHHSSQSNHIHVPEPLSSLLPCTRVLLCIYGPQDCHESRGIQR